VVLSNELQKTGTTGKARKSRSQAENPLEVGGKVVLPSVTRVFRTSQTLTVYLESYDGKAAKNGNGAPAESHPELPPSVGLVFFRGGRKIAEAGPFPGILQQHGSEKASYFVQIPLEKFVPGRYVLQVNVLDPARDRAAFARAPMAVVRGVPRPAAPTAGE